jgi:hypothetical protein
MVEGLIPLDRSSSAAAVLPFRSAGGDHLERKADLMETQQPRPGDGGAVIIKGGDGGPGGPGGSIVITADTRDIFITGGAGGSIVAATPDVEDQDDGTPEPEKPDEDLVRKLRGNGRELLLCLWGQGNVDRDTLWRKIWEGRKNVPKRISEGQKTKRIDRAVVYLNSRLEELGYRGMIVEHNGGLYSLKRPQK